MTVCVCDGVCVCVCVHVCVHDVNVQVCMCLVYEHYFNSLL